MTFGKVAIIGDSYSTFVGCIPENYHAYYGMENHADTGVLRREDTWWDLLIRETGSTLVLNDSYSGSTVCTTGRPDLPAWSAFAVRAPLFFKGETKFDTIFFLGGTNDSWIDSPLGDPTVKEWSDYTDEDKKFVLPAIGYVLGYLRAHNPAARIVAIVNNGLKPEIAKTIIEAAKRFACDTVVLTGISKIHGHPDPLGMKQIKDQILDALKK